MLCLELEEELCRIRDGNEYESSRTYTRNQLAQIYGVSASVIQSVVDTFSRNVTWIKPPVEYEAVRVAGTNAECMRDVSRFQFWQLAIIHREIVKRVSNKQRRNGKVTVRKVAN